MSNPTPLTDWWALSAEARAGALNSIAHKAAEWNWLWADGGDEDAGTRSRSLYLVHSLLSGEPADPSPSPTPDPSPAPSTAAAEERAEVGHVDIDAMARRVRTLKAAVVLGAPAPEWPDRTTSPSSPSTPVDITPEVGSYERRPIPAAGTGYRVSYGSCPECHRAGLRLRDGVVPRHKPTKGTADDRMTCEGAGLLVDAELSRGEGSAVAGGEVGSSATRALEAGLRLRIKDLKRLLAQARAGWTVVDYTVLDTFPPWTDSPDPDEIGPRTRVWGRTAEGDEGWFEYLCDDEGDESSPFVPAEGGYRADVVAWRLDRPAGEGSIDWTLAAGEPGSYTDPDEPAGEGSTLLAEVGAPGDEYECEVAALDERAKARLPRDALYDAYAYMAGYTASPASGYADGHAGEGSTLKERILAGADPRETPEALARMVAEQDPMVGEYEPVDHAGEGSAERRYPCDRCGKLRTKAEGGTTFTVCDACWDAPGSGSGARRDDRGARWDALMATWDAEAPISDEEAAQMDDILDNLSREEGSTRFPGLGHCGKCDVWVDRARWGACPTCGGDVGEGWRTVTTTSESVIETRRSRDRAPRTRPPRRRCPR